MKLSNISEVRKLTKKSSNGITLDTIIYCTVEVETGHLWWKKVSKRQVAKNNVDWFFVDTGEFTPGYQMANLWRSYLAKNELLI